MTYKVTGAKIYHSASIKVDFKLNDVAMLSSNDCVHPQLIVVEEFLQIGVNIVGSHFK